MKTQSDLVVVVSFEVQSCFPKLFRCGCLLSLPSQWCSSCLRILYPILLSKLAPIHHPICYFFLHSLTFKKPAFPIPFPCTFRIFFFFLDLALIPSTYMLSLFFFLFTCQNHFGNFPYNRLHSSINPCVILLPF